jgi:SPP1 family predicted phage head-tail adaptor
VSAGTYRHRVRLVIPATVDDGVGGQVVTTTLGAFLWADVQAVSAREQAIAGAVQTIATHRVRLSYDTRVTAQRQFQRVEPTGTRLQILGVRDVDGRQREMEVDCAEVV